MREKVAVVVARFQVPKLTLGHNHILADARKFAGDSGKVAVVLGTRSKPNRANPLTFEMRRDMVMSGDVAGCDIVLQHPDCPGDDEKWSKGLDHLLGLVFPSSDVSLFSGRDGFKPHYKGAYPVLDAKRAYEDSGTAAREAVELSNTADFRRGVIWAVKNYLPHEGWTDYE